MSEVKETSTDDAPATPLVPKNPISVSRTTTPGKRSTINKYAVASIAALVGVAALLSYVAFQVMWPTCAVATPHIGLAVEAVYATGVVRPEQYAHVSSRVTAHITDILVKEGEQVEAGQELAHLNADVE